MSSRIVIANVAGREFKKFGDGYVVVARVNVAAWSGSLWRLQKKDPANNVLEHHKISAASQQGECLRPLADRTLMLLFSRQLLVDTGYTDSLQKEYRFPPVITGL